MIDRLHEFLWLDLETTGLLGWEPGDLNNRGQVLEFAAVLVSDDRDGDMSIVEEFTNPIAFDWDYAIGAWPLNTHTKSGLMVECKASDFTVADADQFLYEICEMLAGKNPKGITLAGNSVHFDLAWSRGCLPRFASCLSHRVFDVSTLTRAARSWGSTPEEWPAGGDPAHRALDDIRQSVATAAKWRKAMIL